VKDVGGRETEHYEKEPVRSLDISKGKEGGPYDTSFRAQRRKRKEGRGFFLDSPRQVSCGKERD